MTKQPLQKKKQKLQQKKTAFRSSTFPYRVLTNNHFRRLFVIFHTLVSFLPVELKIAHDNISEKKSQQQKRSKTKRKARGSQSLNTMKSLADTLDALSDQYSGSRRDLAMKIKHVTTSKQRDTIMKEERSRMSEVLNHPMFIANPLGAIMSHLEATLPSSTSEDNQMKH